MHVLTVPNDWSRDHAIVHVIERTLFTMCYLGIWGPRWLPCLARNIYVYEKQTFRNNWKIASVELGFEGVVSLRFTIVVQSSANFLVSAWPRRTIIFCFRRVRVQVQHTLENLRLKPSTRPVSRPPASFMFHLFITECCYYDIFQVVFSYDMRP